MTFVFSLLTIQTLLGLLDTVWNHEIRERLPARRTARCELALHAARVLVHRDARGVAWDREYQWADGTRSLVRSTKVVTGDGFLVEMLPARLCMPLDTFEEGGVLHFVSRGYYFDLGLGLKLWLPGLLSPGITHVEHIDLGHGWFRFTMTVTHRLFGTVFFQTGRFCAAEDLS